MTPERFNRINTVLDHRQTDLTVITDEVHKLRNVSAIIRTCDAVGVDRIHAIRPKAGFRFYRGTALGSEKWVEVEYFDSTVEVIKQKQSEGYQVVAAHLSPNAVDYQQLDYTKPTALLMGTEKQGISGEALALVDQVITIPMMGMTASFNVSVACAIIMNEARAQRQSAGYYGQRKLPDSVCRERLFRWGYPDLADYCHRYNLDYPELDETGNLRDGPGWYQQAKEKVSLQKQQQVGSKAKAVTDGGQA